MLSYQDNQPKIKVIIRKRPLNKKQIHKGEKDIVTIKDKYTVAVKEEKLKVDLTKYTDQYIYNFDGAYNQFNTNPQLYQQSVKPLIQSAFLGAKVTCFAYGQTGSGKTYTMLGNHQNHIPGLYLLAAYDIFKKLTKYQYQKYSIWISFYQIYCGKLYDLLNERTILFARQDAKQNVNIVGLQQKKINSPEMLMQIIEYGSSVRITSQNSANTDSSRSHAVLQINIKQVSKNFGKISFIDLAGSQRGADHADQSKQTRIDGAEINKSLLALKECIRALDQNKHHTPFRGSKLTMVLKDSFVGYCKSLMIGTISPGDQSCENTLNTLKYADRVKQLKKSKQQDNGKQYMDRLSAQLMLPRHNRNRQMQVLRSNKLIMQQQQVDEQLNQNFNNNNIKFKGINIFQKPKPEVIKNDFPKNMKRVAEQQNYMMKQIKQTKPSPIKHDINQLTLKHESLINTIINQQEELLELHQQHIIETVETVKVQSQLLGQIDRINSDVNQYLHSLEQLLNKKETSIKNLKKKVENLQNHILESQQIQKIFNQQRANHYQNLTNNDQLLLDDLEEYPQQNRLFY